jgi:hypothetical protein
LPADIADKVKRLLPQLVGAALVVSASSTLAQPAPTPATEPSAAALALARLLAPPSFADFRRVADKDAAAALEQQLLNSHYAPRGAPCAPDDPACVAAARQVAAKYGTLEARFAARIIDEGYARLFDATMSPADISASTAFLRTGSGAKFRAALFALSAPRQGDFALFRRIYEATIAGETSSPTRGMFDEFYDRTQSLPRAPARPAPFAPPPPSPPRQ